MRKLFLSIIALMFSIGLWAQETQTVSYLYPVYNTPDDPKSGIKEWKTDTVEATKIWFGTTTLNAGWYFVLSGATTDLGGALTCNGEVHLILTDGATLKVSGKAKAPGIQVSGDGNSLTVYRQAGKQEGELVAYGEQEYAGIGGGKNGSGSNITINGGIVTASCGLYNNGTGAGIGGGEGGSGSEITINGGTITANGGEFGAGIGGGQYGSGFNITINDDTVTATGGQYCAGIGGGERGYGSDITINGGTVTANGGEGGAGIGGGQHGSGSDITINYGTVAANGGEGSAGIGGGEYGGAGENITVAVSCLVKAGGSENPTTIIEIDGGDIASILAGKRYVTVKPHPAYARGKEEGKAEALGEMGEPCEDCPSVEVTGQNDNMIKLYNPKSVTFKKD